MLAPQITHASLATSDEVKEFGEELAKKGYTLIGQGTIEVCSCTVCRSLAAFRTLTEGFSPMQVDTEPEPSTTTFKILASETGVTSSWTNIEAHGKMGVAVDLMRLAVLMRLTVRTPCYSLARQRAACSPRALCAV